MWKLSNASNQLFATAPYARTADTLAKSSFTIEAILGLSGATAGHALLSADQFGAIRSACHCDRYYSSVASVSPDSTARTEQKPSKAKYAISTTSHHKRKIGDGADSAGLRSSAANKSKRVRTIFTPEQLERLESEFERQQYMVGPERLYLASALQLSEAQVKVWFQNRRIKWRKQHLEVQLVHNRFARRAHSPDSDGDAHA